MALHRPPGLTRKHFGFMGWMDFDVRLWTALRDEARRGVGKRLEAPILGSDIRGDATRAATGNARAAGVGNLLSFDVKDVRDFTPPEGPPGTILCNPPYGERIGEEKELKPVYRAFGQALMERCPGWTAWVFSGNAALARRHRHRAGRVHTVLQRQDSVPVPVLQDVNRWNEVETSKPTGGDPWVGGVCRGQTPPPTGRRPWAWFVLR